MWHLQLHLHQKAVVAAHDQLLLHVGCWSSVQVLHDEKRPIAGDVLVTLCVCRLLRPSLDCYQGR